MDFESPDVEKDFPGLYASETIRKCNDSDFSDDNHDKSFKKELIIGKRKEKKDSKKDRGYATLEGESSPDEEVDSRSPCKSKKSKSFKFPTKKSEKREKSREKDVEKKDKDVEKDKKKDKEKKEKEKTKHKEKKKIKAGDESTEANEDFPVFGVSLSTAVERNGCLDGVPIPLVVRNCIDCIHSFGLNVDGLYKDVGMKSKVLALKKSYNIRDAVCMGECDVPVATCLLRLFLRELPEPILTNELLTRFEEAGAIMKVDAREKELQNLITQLPEQNRVLLGWLIVHFDTVTMHEKQNKLNAQSIAMTFSPVLQMSHRLLTAFLCHCKALFSDIVIQRYNPPLCPGSAFPETPDEIALELKKQEFLLNQIHKEMSEGFVSKKKEEQLWEVQRIVTQLKRKLKGLQRFQEASFAHKSLEEEHHAANEENSVESKKQSLERENSQTKPKDSKENLTESVKNEEEVSASNPESRSSATMSEESNETENSQEKSSPVKQVPVESAAKSTRKDWNLEELREQLEHEELLKFQSSLQGRIDREKELISKLKTEILTCNGKKAMSPIGIESVGGTARSEPELNIEKLDKDNQMLQKKMKDLTLKIFEERLACIKLKVYIDILEMPTREGSIPV